LKSYANTLISINLIVC